MRNGYVWDDDLHVSENPVLRSAAGLSAIWFHPSATVQYYPLTFSVFWIGYHLWGLHAVGFHVLNIGTHAGVALLLWRLLTCLRVPGAFAGACIFAVHPVNVMSVAWMTELKNTLSSVLALSACLAYLRFAGIDDKPTSDADSDGDVPHRWRWYAVALGSFALAMLAKTAVSFLPVTLALILWWKDRIRWRHALALAPFVLVSAGMGVVTILVERMHGGDVGATYALGLAERCIVSGRSFWFYLSKLAAPHPLVFIYDRWSIDPRDPLQYVPALATAAALVLPFLARRRIGKGPFVAVAHFYIATSALIFFVVTFFTRYSWVSDHWQYFGLMSMAAMAGAGLSQIPLFSPSARGTSVIAVTGLLAILTWRQCRIYKDEVTLWNETLARNPRAWMADSNLGAFYYKRGDVVRAVSYFREAHRLAPQDANTHFSLARSLMELERADDAAPLCAEERSLWPADERTLENAALLALLQGRSDDAERLFDKVLRAYPDSLTAHANLADILDAKGRSEEADAHRAALARIIGNEKATQIAPLNRSR